MFGKNPIRPVEIDGNKLAVENIFYTLQGEGPYSGTPALFIRMAGCNLRCVWCDTQFETQADTPQSAEHWIRILTKYSSQQREFVVLTGGEPLRQNVVGLIRHLLNTGTEVVQIETAGTLWQPLSLEQDEVEDEFGALISEGRVVLVCSPKTPKIHPKIATYCEHWKYIIRADEIDEDDGLPNCGTQVGNQGLLQRIYRAEKNNRNKVWLSPCDDYDAVKNKANRDLARDLCLRHGYRLSLQVHKLVGVE